MKKRATISTALKCLPWGGMRHAPRYCKSFTIQCSSSAFFRNTLNVNFRTLGCFATGSSIQESSQDIVIGQARDMTAQTQARDVGKLRKHHQCTPVLATDTGCTVMRVQSTSIFAGLAGSQFCGWTAFSLPGMARNRASKKQSFVSTNAIAELVAACRIRGSSQRLVPLIEVTNM